MSKSNTNKVKNQMQKMNLEAAKEITIKCIEGDAKTIKSFSSSSVFKLYLKSQLQHKALCINYTTDLTFLDSKISIQVIKSSSENESFTVSSDTVIEIDVSSQQVDLLSKDIEKKLNVEDIALNSDELSEESKKILKEIIESKALSKDTIVSNIDLVINEDIYEKIVKILSYQLTPKDNNKESILTNKEKELSYFYKGILLSGNSGIGKTHLINYIKKKYLIENKIAYFDIDMYKHFDDRDKAVSFIKSIFTFAKLLSPSVIIIENIDAIFNKKDDTESTVSTSTESFEFNTLLSVFIREIDTLPSNVIVLASSINSNNINKEVIKYNRIDYTINLPLPNRQQRKLLIDYYLKDFVHDLTIDDIESIADKTHGFVAGDIAKLFKESYLCCAHSSLDKLTRNVIESTMSEIKPINLKDIIIDVPKVKWSDIGGNKSIINLIRQSVEWPLKHPDAFKRLGITAPNGTLLYGPPGCSKTLIAKALATEAGLNFFAVKGPELFSKYVGDTEKAVRDVFKKARMSSPSIIFFDEIDAMATQRGDGGSSGVEDKVLCQLLNEMDGIEGRERVVIFAATNRPDILDKALIRPGRFDRLVYIPPPDAESREDIFKIVLKGMKVEENVDIKELSSMTELFSGADIAKVAREAGMMTLSEDINAEFVKKEHIINAIKRTKSVITKEMIAYYEGFAKKMNE